MSLHASKISIVLALQSKGAMSSTQLAEHIGLSRQLIESRLKGSVEDGFFDSLPDPEDSRKRIYSIAPSAETEVKRIVEVMLDFEQVYAKLWQEIGMDLEVGLKAMEQQLKKQSLLYRLFDYAPRYEQQANES